MRFVSGNFAKKCISAAFHGKNGTSGNTALKNISVFFYKAAPSIAGKPSASYGGYSRRIQTYVRKVVEGNEGLLLLAVSNWQKIQVTDLTTRRRVDRFPCLYDTSMATR